MNLSETIAWVLVELDSRRPDLSAVKQALENASVEAARLAIKQHVGQNNLVRLAQVWGDLPGGGL